MFGINEYDNAGFHITFKNGWTVSVQFGQGNYCENKSKSKSQCVNAEIAAWDANDKWYSFEYDNVKGYCDADEVADFITMIKAKEN